MTILLFLASESELRILKSSSEPCLGWNIYHSGLIFYPVTMGVDEYFALSLLVGTLLSFPVDIQNRTE